MQECIKTKMPDFQIKTSILLTCVQCRGAKRNHGSCRSYDDGVCNEPRDLSLINTTLIHHHKLHQRFPKLQSPIIRKSSKLFPKQPIDRLLQQICANNVKYIYKINSLVIKCFSDLYLSLPKQYIPETSYLINL